MSLQFSDTSTKKGILQIIEKRCKLGDGGITGNTVLKSQFTADVNLAYDKVLAFIFRAGGTWQFDDSNQGDYPIITTNIISGQRDYSFTNDGNSNLVLEIYRVLVADPAAIFHQMVPVDVSSARAPMSFVDGLNVGGQPVFYDKLANGIFLDPVPNYNLTGGLKIYVSREASYFTSSDTTKKPGFAGLFHNYLAIEPAYNYAASNGLSNAPALQKEMVDLETAIGEYYQDRERDVQKVIRPVFRSSR